MTTISNAHGNYTTLALLHVSQPQLYLIYPAGHAIACQSFALPGMLPAPRVLTRDALLAAGFKDNGQLPLRDEALQQATTPTTPHKQPATTLYFLRKPCLTLTPPAAFAQNRSVLASGARAAVGAQRNCNNFQAFTDGATGLAAAATGLDFMGSQFMFRCDV